MKKYLALALSCAAIGAFFYISRSEDKPRATETAPPPIKQTPGVLGKIEAFEGLPKVGKSFSASSCGSFFQMLATSSMRALVFDFNEAKFSIPEQCDTDSFTNQLLQQLRDNCKNPVDNIKTCHKSLLKMRTRLIQLATDGQALHDLTVDVLIQRFFGLFMSQAIKTAAGAKEARAIAGELENRSPDSAMARKMKMASYLLDPSLSPQEKAEYDDFLRLAREKDPEDWQVFELELIAKIKTDPEGFAKRVDDFYHESPNNPIAVYYKGCLAWKQGSKPEAVSQFRKAIELLPSEARFAETLAKTENSSPPAPICVIAVTVREQDF